MAWSRFFGVHGSDAAAKLPWQFVATFIKTEKKPTWDKTKWDHEFWSRGWTGSLELNVRVLHNPSKRATQADHRLRTALLEIQNGQEWEDWPGPPETTPASALSDASATQSTDNAQCVDLRVVQMSYQAALLKINSCADVNVVNQEVGEVVNGKPLIVETGPFFAHLSLLQDVEGWQRDRLQLYIGKKLYNEESDFNAADAILSEDVTAPLANLFRENQMLGLPGPIEDAFLKHVDPTKSTITVQAFTDESRGFNYNWVFMWARLRAAASANELVKAFYTSQQNDGGNRAFRFC